MENVYEKLLAKQVGKVLKDEPLKNHTTMKIGGPADIYVEPNSIEGLEQVVKCVKEASIPLRVIGRGSNLLVHDNGIRGVVIKLGDSLDHVEVNETKVLVGGGYSLIKLATIISKKGLSGLEFVGGIPGSVGGAVFMNAGAHGSDMSKIVTRARILFEDGTLEWLTNEELAFSYRTSVLQKDRPGICVEAELRMEKGDREKIVSEMQKHKDYRRETQPWNYPCCGSVFRNPLPNHAGQLIEEAGLKGYQIGGAQVSEMHANFIVNTGTAKAKDVLELISYIKATIKAKFGVEMEIEVEIIGEN